MGEQIRLEIELAKQLVNAGAGDIIEDYEVISNNPSGSLDGLVFFELIIEKEGRRWQTQYSLLYDGESPQYPAFTFEEPVFHEIAI